MNETVAYIIAIVIGVLAGTAWRLKRRGLDGFWTYGPPKRKDSPPKYTQR